MMHHLRSLSALCAAAIAATALAAAPLVAAAQTSTFYSPPKVIKFGKNTTPVAGSGTVRLKVFVHKNGSVGSVEVLKSTNRGDDRAAVEIAKSSTYKPGARDAKPQDAFYTIDLKFTGSSLANAPAARANETGAAAGGARQYADQAADALKAKNTAQAIALAQKSLAAQPNANAYYIEGVAYLDDREYDKATTALEQAKTMAQSGHADAGTLNAIDSQLVQAYLLGGDTQKGIALAQDLKRRDPSNTRVDNVLAAYYNQRAQTAAKAGKRDEAIADLESGAKAAPGSAAILYTNAAQLLAQNAKSKEDWQRVKAEADKALAVDPNNANANYVAGVALGNSGDLPGAKAALEKAKANAASDPQLSAQIDAQLAQLAKLGQK
jgi:TonB family protein